MAQGSGLHEKQSPAKAWARALQLTAPIGRQPERTLATVIDEFAETSGSAPALLSDGECLTYQELAERSNRYARWALDHGVGRGDVVCLLMPNRPEYMAIWLGIVRAGGIVALLNTNLVGRSLAHCINIVCPTHIIVAQSLSGSMTTANADLTCTPAIWIEPDVEGYAGVPLENGERRSVSVHDRALYIYTSGTTGLPKAATISHARLMQWSHWFAGLLDTTPSDRMYNCLPMYHSVGGVLATGAVLAGGGSVVIRDGFSATQFWPDVVRWNCTLFQYIGELCRYLLHVESHPRETEHHLRMCCGNGLRPDIWTAFKDRFQIPQILEFYASTEGNVSLFNVDGHPGAIGRIPPFLAHRFPAMLVRFDVERGEPVRNEQGLCLRSAPHEPGEAIGRILADPSNVGTWFEGYTSREDSDRKILRDVVERGDTWFRTGDLMRQDEKGYFYFLDRIGDTFRWKGENVSTTEVSEALCSFPGIREANVYGVTVPGTDGRAGMAAIVSDADVELAALRRHLVERLPAYARPLFLRIRCEMDTTATFKYTKNDLVKQAFDPTASPDAIYFDAAERAAFVRLDSMVFDRINAGLIRL